MNRPGDTGACRSANGRPFAERQATAGLGGPARPFRGIPAACPDRRGVAASVAAADCGKTEAGDGGRRFRPMQLRPGDVPAMADVLRLNLIHLFTFYLAAAFGLSTLRRLRQYHDVAQL